MNNPSSFLLIDTALFDGAHPIHALKAKQRFKWLRPLYDRSALSVSPIVVDIAEAYRSNRVDLMMSTANHGLRDFGLSLIEAELGLEAVVEHLRNFMYFADSDGNQFTLRLADCAVLAALSVTFTEDQWSALMRPFQRWRIHGRDGKLIDLPRTTAATIVNSPLVLTSLQIAQLRSLAEPDRLLANLQTMRPAILSNWKPVDAHQTATEVIEIWGNSRNQDHSTLLIFARAVFESGAKLLRQGDLGDLLKGRDQASIRQEIEIRLRQYVFET